MEIQVLCRDKRALPQCGWVCMQRNNLVRLLFMQTYTTCVSSEAGIFIMSTLKPELKMENVRLFFFFHVMHCIVHVIWSQSHFVFLTSKESQIDDERWLCNVQNVTLLAPPVRKLATSSRDTLHNLKHDFTDIFLHTFFNYSVESVAWPLHCRFMALFYHARVTHWCLCSLLICVILYSVCTFVIALFVALANYFPWLLTMLKCTMCILTHWDVLAPQFSLNHK